MKASIIITTFNRPVFLERAIKSVLDQTFLDYEIIVVDDNGNGTSQQIETEFIVKKYPLITYLPLQENAGACVARNEGVKIASGKYIFFLDDDDTYKPNKIQTQVHFMDEHPNLDGCLSAFERIDSEGGIIEAPANYPKVGNFISFAMEGNFFTPMLCIKKTSLDAMGGFKNIARFQDRFLMLHCLSEEQVFGIINEPLYTLYDHREERITATGLSNTLVALEEINYLVDKHKNKFSKKQWRRYSYSYLRSIATAHYVNSSYFVKLKGVKYWAQLFFFRFKLSDFLMILKSVVPK